MPRLRVWLPLGALVLALSLAGTAEARFHLWTIEELFSNPDGSVQFVEMFDAFNDEDLLAGHLLSSNSKSFAFTTNLPTLETANHHLLLATANFAALPGAVTPDYVLPANFFSVTADRLNFADVSLMEFSAGELPVDGVHSLLLNLSTGQSAPAVNSPTNFAGQAGSVVILTHPWQNPAGALDVNDDGNIFPQDVLIIINELNAHGLRALAVPPVPPDGPPPYYDTTGDDFLSPQDVILVINHLNSVGPGPRGAGAAVPEPAPLLAMLLGFGLLAGFSRLRRRRGLSDRQIR